MSVAVEKEEEARIGDGNARHPNKDPNARPECFSSTAQEVLFVISVTLAVAMAAFLSGAVTVSATFAGRDLNMSNAEITWLNAATSLASGSLLLFFGSIADLFGRKTMFIGSMFLFAVLCLGAGFAKDGITLDALCGVLGIFSASAVPSAQGMLGTIYDQPSQRKNRVFGCFSAGNPLGFVFGIIFAGLATELFSWRAAFWLLAIVYLVVSVLAALFVPSDHSKKVPLNRETLKRLDLPGTSLTIFGIGMFCAALTLGGDAENGWRTPYVLVLLLLGILLIVAFIVWEIKYPYAMIDMRIWKDRNFSLLMAIVALGFIGFPISTYWLSLWFQRFKGYNALMTGVHMLPMFVCGVLVNVVAALIQHKVSNKILMAIGAFAYLISFVLMAVQRSSDSYWAFSFLGLCLVVVGADFQFVVTNMYVMSSMPADKQSIAGSLLQTLTRLSQAVGFGIATAIFDAVQKSPSSSGYYANDPIEPYVSIFWFAAGVAALGVVLVPFLTIGTQGHDGDKGRLADTSSEDVAAPFTQLNLPGGVSAPVPGFGVREDVSAPASDLGMRTEESAPVPQLRTPSSGVASARNSKEVAVEVA